VASPGRQGISKTGEGRCPLIFAEPPAWETLVILAGWAGKLDAGHSE